MGRTQHNLSLIASAQNKMSAPMKAAASDVEKYARKLSESDEKLAKSSASLSAQRKRQLSAGQKVRFALAAEAAAGKPLQLRIVALDKVHAQLTKRLGALARAGQPLPPQMVKMAAAAKKNADALRKQADASDKQGSSMGKVPWGRMIAAAGAATAALGVLVVRYGRMGDELAKTSRKLGVSIESLQVYRKAAADSGVATGAMDNALRSLARRSADAAAGNVEFAKGFEALGVEVKNADGSLKSVDQLLPEMADGMASLGSAGERTSAAMKTMGIGGAAMLPMLQAGSGALAEMTDKASRLGGVMTDEAVLAGEELTQNLGDLQFASIGLGNALLAELAPSLSGAAKWMAKFASDAAWALGVVQDQQRVTTTLVGDTIDEQIGHIDRLVAARKREVKDILTGEELRKQVQLELDQLGLKRTQLIERRARAEAAAKAAAAREATRLMKEEERNQTRDAETGSKARQAAASAAMHERSKMIIADARERQSEADKIQADNLKQMDAFNREVAKQDADLAKEKEKFAKTSADFQIKESERSAKEQAKAVADLERTLTTAASAIRSSFVTAYQDSQKEGVSASEATGDALIGLGKTALSAAADYAIAEGIKMLATKLRGSVETAVDVQTTASAVTASSIKSGAAISSATTQIGADMAAGTTSTTAAYAGIPFAGPVLAAAAVAVLVGIMLAAKGKMKGFAEGGEVTGGTPGKDSVAALLTPGEVVLSVPQVKGLRRLVGAGSGSASPTASGALGFAQGGTVPQQQQRAAMGSIVVNIAAASSRVAQRKQARQMAMNIRQMQRRGL